MNAKSLIAIAIVGLGAYLAYRIAVRRGLFAPSGGPAPSTTMTTPGGAQGYPWTSPAARAPVIATPGYQGPLLDIYAPGFAWDWQSPAAPVPGFGFVARTRPTDPAFGYDGPLSPPRFPGGDLSPFITNPYA